MKLWTIWVQGDDSTWLEAAWEDEMTAENHSGWQTEVERVRVLAYENKYEMRIVVIELDGGAVYDAFDFTVAKALAITKPPDQGNKIYYKKAELT